MSDKTITFSIDGVEVKGTPGQTIMQAAEEAGIYIPRLCYLKDITPHRAAVNSDAKLADTNIDVKIRLLRSAPLVRYLQTCWIYCTYWTAHV